MNMLKKYKKLLILVATVVVLAGAAGYVYSRQQTKTAVTDGPTLSDAGGCGQGGYLYLVVHKETSAEAVKKAAKAVGGEASRDHYDRPVYHISLDRKKEDAAIKYFQKLPMTETIEKSSPTCIQ